MPLKSGLLQSLHQTLASMKLSIFVFLTLAVSSLLGTLLPQGLTEHELHSRFSPGMARLIEFLGLNDLYHTGWFRFLLLLLATNLIICTLQRLPKTISQLKHREESIVPEKLTKFSQHQLFDVNASLEQLKPRLQDLMAAEFAPIQPVENSEVFAGVVETGRWSRWMVYLVHLSVLLILIGALIGSLAGFKGFMNIPEGSASQEVHLYRGNQTITLPFAVRCDDFDVTFYDMGAPREYRSDLTIIDGGKDVLQGSIIVNDPLTYNGITLYQSSYGAILKEAEVEFVDKESGTAQRMVLPFGEAKTIPGTADRVQIVDYQQSMGQFGPAVGIALQREGQPPKGSWILVKMPQFHGNKIDNYHINVIQTVDGYYTGLQVKKDPGVWVVYTGFIALMLGIGMTFYSSHRKLWIWAGPVSGGSQRTRIVLAGRSNKNPVAFEKDFQQLCERLRNDLRPTGERD